jgi:hypothetical protein
MISFTEYLNLNEAYSANMITAIPAEQLTEIGNFLAKTEKVSVQLADFIELPKTWKKSDYTIYQYVIWQFNDGSVSISKQTEYADKHHFFIYPKKMELKGINKKDVKCLWGFNKNKDDNTKTKAKIRAKNSTIKDKLFDIQDKMKRLSPTNSYKQLESLVNKEGFKIDTAYVSPNNHIIITLRSKIKFPETIMYYNDKNNDWTINVSYSDKISKIDEYVKYLENIKKFKETLLNSNIDLSQLPQKTYRGYKYDFV